MYSYLHVFDVVHLMPEKTETSIELLQVRVDAQRNYLSVSLTGRFLISHLDVRIAVIGGRVLTRSRRSKNRRDRPVVGYQRVFIKCLVRRV